MTPAMDRVYRALQDGGRAYALFLRPEGGGVARNGVAVNVVRPDGSRFMTNRRTMRRLVAGGWVTTRNTEDRMLFEVADNG